MTQGTEVQYVCKETNFQSLNHHQAYFSTLLCIFLTMVSSFTLSETSQQVDFSISFIQEIQLGIPQQFY